MRVGVIGVCGFGQHHAKAFAELGCEIVAVADTSERVDNFAAQYSAKSYLDYHHLLEEDIDAVSIALPPALHPQVVQEFAQRGIAVFCEKPVASSAKEAQRLLVDLGSEAPVAVGFCFRFNPVYRRLKEAIQNGELGRIRSVLARKCWGTRTSWRLKKGGGAVFVKDIHYYDLVPWLLDDIPTQLSAHGGAFYHESEVEDSYHLLMSFSKGTIFQLDSAWWTLPTGVGSFEVVGSKERVVVEGDTLHFFGDQIRDEIPGGEPMVKAEITAFVQWLEGSGPKPPGLVEAVRASEYAQQVVDLIQGNQANSRNREEEHAHNR